VSGFAGAEPEILRLRNTNRDSPETLEYLRWRYHTAPGCPPPVVCWLHAPGGERIGMAAAIFRAYRFGDERVPTAVIGDISLDARWRGRGLGERLLRHLSEHLDEHHPRCPCLVIPTDSARRSLAAAGWVTGGELLPMVYLSDVGPYLKPLVRSARLASFLARPLRRFAGRRLQRLAPPAGTLELADVPPERVVDSPWGGEAAMVRDLSGETLHWRYVRHPRMRFRFAAFREAGAARGLAVFEDHAAAGYWIIYDLRAATAADLRATLALLLERARATPRLSSVRVLLSGSHPAHEVLRQLGYIARPAEAVYQVHSRDGSAERRPWYLTQGDKDT